MTKATDTQARSPEIAYLAAKHLDVLADKVQRNIKLSDADRTAITDVLHRAGTAQREWDSAYSLRLPAERDRAARLIGILARLLNRWP
jgi:hypothetical protein